MTELFDVMEPPPGGLARLRARLDAEQRRQIARQWAVPVFAAAAAALALLAVRPAPEPRLDHPNLVAFGLAPVPDAAVDVRTGVGVPVETPDPSVVFVMVGRRLADRGPGAGG